MMLHTIVFYLYVCLSLYQLPVNGISAQVLKPASLNIVFLIGHDKGSLLGSEILRGIMMEEAIKIHPNCNSSIIIYHSNSANSAEAFEDFRKSVGKVHVCVSVKTRSKFLEPLCRKSGAIVMVDVLDEFRIMSELALLVENKEMVKDFNYGIDEVMILQCEKQASMLRTLGRRAYAVPHQHTNPGICGEKKIKQKGADDKLVIGFLTGSPFTGLKRDLNMVVDAVCAAGAEFRNVEQVIRLINEGDKKSSVTSRTTTYPCNSSRPITKTIVTSIKIEGDTHVQCAFYADEALKDIDVGLVWRAPHTKFIANTPTSVHMYRPPTRMLHWMSRGVPVLYYPIYSYLEVAGLHGYGNGLNVTLAVENGKMLEEAVKLLVLSPESRVKLGEDALKTAKDYTVVKIADRFIKVMMEELENVKSNNTVAV